MAPIYDYVITVRVTSKAGATEDFEHPMQAYTLQEAVLAALIELEAVHKLNARGTVEVVRARPDVEAMGAAMRSVLDQATMALRDGLGTLGTLGTARREGR